MVDLSKHLARAKQAIERRNYDLAMEITQECQELDPANLENYQLLIEAAKRRAKESGGKGTFFGLKVGGLPTLGKDPHKLLTAAVKRAAKDPDLKNLMAVGDAARAVGGKGMVDVSILFYSEARGTGLFSGDLLWNLAHAYMDKYNEGKDRPSLDNAITVMGEFEMQARNHPLFPEAGRKARAWEALRSTRSRDDVGKATDYRSQMASEDNAKRNEVMNRIIRTTEDARAVLAYVDADLAKSPEDKSLWLKKGDVHRRINEFAEARAAYEKAQAIDKYDFVVALRLGDLLIAEKQEAVSKAKAAGQDVTALEADLAETEIAEYRKRIDRQPTEMSHRFGLASRLYRKGDIDAAAAEFQQSVKDPRFRKKSHSYLGHAFAKKNLLDLARDQFTSCLSLIDDHLSDEYKEALYNRGRINEVLGRKEDAATDFTKVVEIDLSYKDAAERIRKLRGG